MVSESGADVTPPAEAVAMLVTTPTSSASCVTVKSAVQVSDAAGASPPAGKAGQTTLAMRLSSTVIGSTKVTLPVLVTTYS